MKIKIFIILFAIPILSMGQSKISGRIFNAKNGEILPGAFIIESGTKNSTITNQYGYFFLNTNSPKEIINLVVTYLGYETLRISVEKSEDIPLGLNPKPFTIDEIVVYDNQISDKPMKAGHFQMNSIELNHLPSFSGETDLTTFMQLIPGVAIAGEGNTALNVRGGSNDQNLFLIDDLPLYYVNHLGGFLSTFNSDIIKTTDLYKNGFPARYGGRLSSIVDVRTNDGNLNKYDIYGTLGLISSKLGIEGPLIKDKSSFLLSFRKNTIPFFRWLYDLNVDYNFYDTNVKLNYIFSTKDRIFFSFYNGNDKVAINNYNENNENHQSVSWGNIAGSVRYSRLINSSLYFNLIIGNTTYGYRENSYSKQIENDSGSRVLDSEFISTISDNFLKLNFEYYPSENIQINAGYEYINHKYIPGKSSLFQTFPSGTNDKKTNYYPESTTNEHNIYAQANIQNLYGYEISIGVRTTALINKNQTYFLADPRVSLTRNFGTRFQLTAAYDIMHQNFHLLTNQGTGIPVEYRIPVISFAPPEKSEMISAGFSFFPHSKKIQLNVDFYKKFLSGLITLKNGVDYSSTFKNWENINWNKGKGKSKGIEIMLRKTQGNSTGWIGATLANTDRTFTQVYNGNSYPYKYDRPFEFKSYFLQKLNKRFSLSATWVYGSGLPLTIPIGQYIDLDGEVLLIYGEKNSARGNPFHRLDVGLTYKLFPKWGESEWNLSIINIYNRKNPYYYFTNYDRGFGGSGKMTLYEQSLFPFLPSISYSFKF